MGIDHHARRGAKHGTSRIHRRRVEDPTTASRSRRTIRHRRVDPYPGPGEPSSNRRGRGDRRAATRTVERAHRRAWWGTARGPVRRPTLRPPGEGGSCHGRGNSCPTSCRRQPSRAQRGRHRAIAPVLHRDPRLRARAHHRAGHAHALLPVRSRPPPRCGPGPGEEPPPPSEEAPRWRLGARTVGVNHIAVAYPDRESFLAQLAHLQANGVAFALRGNHGMTHSVYVADPDGNGIEVLYELPAEVWEGDVKQALLHFEALPKEGPEALEDDADYPVFVSREAR
ncbi:MAG: VOC family protein [Acidimicrobiales bacterium]